MTGRYWISGQVNVVLQGYEAFKAEDSGPNSLTNWAQSATTHLLTLNTGYEISQSTEVFADVEDTTGNGVGKQRRVGRVRQPGCGSVVERCAECE